METSMSGTPTNQSVAELQQSVQEVISLRASNISELAKGKTPDILLDDTLWDEVLKIIDKWPKFVAFDGIVNGSGAAEVKSADVTEEKVVNPANDTNAFEERSKAIKARLNGKTHIDK
jgi:hypothetical protein